MISLRKFSVLTLTLALPACVSTTPLLEKSTSALEEAVSSLEKIISENPLNFDINKVPTTIGPTLSPASLPKYVVGETFEFDDGRIDTVKAVNGERIVWTNKYDVDVLRYRNFIVPDLEWRSENRNSSLDTDVIPTDLWPLSPGKISKRFHALQEITWPEEGRKPVTIDYDWQCRVNGTQTVSVPAGTFDTFVVGCYRYRADSSIMRQTRTFYYAPSLNHFVKRTDEYQRGRPKTITLVSAGFASSVLGNEEADLARTLFKALDNLPNAQPVTWVTANKNTSIKITPETTYRNAEGSICRRYQSAYHYQGRVRSNQRTLCKTGNGTWTRVFDGS